MRLELKRKEILFISSVTLFFLIVSIAGWFMFGEIIFGVLGTLAIALLLVGQIKLYHMLIKFHDARYDDYRQIESLFSLFSLLKLKAPLPPMRDWAASPDLLKTIVSVIYETKPETIFELGSGVSTIIAAYCLKNLGRGSIVSFDNDPHFSSVSKKNLTGHGLQDTGDVVYAPLKEIEIHGDKWLWYDTEKLDDIESIDLLIVDGPPETKQFMARYPALPILFDRLSKNAVIIADDTKRDQECKTVEMWLKEFDCLSLERIPTEKGVCVLRKN